LTPINLLKGPGVCIFNDARFSDKDWLGIRKIYSSNKRGEPLKIGRFGLGFKSIFHLTGIIYQLLVINTNT